MNWFSLWFLKHYPEKDHTLRMKARFLFRICLAILVFLPATITSTVIINLHNPELNYQLNLQVILTDAVAFVTLLIIVYLLYKGFFTFAAHLFINVAFLVVWVIIAFDPQTTLIKLDTIAFQLALLSLLPLVIKKNTGAILFYTSLNIGALLVFLYFSRDSLGISHAEVWEFFFDNMFAMVIIGVAAYNVFSINKDALDRSEAEIKTRKQKEDELRASEERYRSVVENQTEMIVRFTPAETITFVNNALRRYFLAHLGCTDDYIDLSINKLKNIELANVLRRILLLFTGENPINEMEHSLTGISGETCWTIWIARALYDEKGNLVEFQVIGRDITEKKKAEEEKARLEDQLYQAQKMESIGRLAGGVSHDFNNLLTVISGNIQLAIMDLGGGNPTIPLLEEANKAAADASSLTNQLLAFSRKQIIEPRIIDLNQLIGQTSKLLARVIGENVELRIAQGTPSAAIKADPTQIEQILINLAVNARDAMPNGGKLTIETAEVVLDEFYCQRNVNAKIGTHVLMAVSDTGAGMSETVKQHLFEPFYTTKPMGKGTGLGLATIYGAVSQNYGTIEVYSTPDHGTTFKVYFPKIEGEIERLARTVDAEDLKYGTETILLVEDEPQVLKFARTVLTRLGYTVLSCSSAEDALALPAETLRTASLLITDVILPGMNGRMLADEISALNQHVRVLYASGYTNNIIAHHGVLEKDIEFIGKPYTARSLSARVREVLDAKR